LTRVQLWSPITSCFVLSGHVSGRPWSSLQIRLYNVLFPRTQEYCRRSICANRLIHILCFRGVTAYNSIFILYIHCKSMNLWISRINNSRCTGCVHLCAYEVFFNATPKTPTPYVVFAKASFGALCRSAVFYSPNNLLTLLSTLSFSGSYGWSLLGISSTAGNASV